MSISFNLPLGSVSFGQVSTAILREVYKRKLDCCIFPIGQVDLSTQNPDKEFEQWLHQTIKTSNLRHKSTNRVIKLWHIGTSNESYIGQNELITFLETDFCTPLEANILNNQKRVWVTSNYTKQVMEDAGVNNVKYLELGFDSFNFKKLDKKYYPEGITVIGFGGKFETTRKKHVEIIRALAERYGGRRDIMIHAAVYNPFISKEDNEKLINYAFGGKKYFNFVFLPFMTKNAEYNDFLNSCDIFLGMSGGEGVDLPVKQSLSLGKKIVGLNAHAYKDYLTNDNSWLVEPNGKCPAADGMFFHANSDINQGNFYTWDKNTFLDKVDEAIKSPKKQPFIPTSYSKTLDILLEG